MKNFDPPSDFKVNLFKDTSYFNSYEILYSEIYKVNKLAEESLVEFKEFVEAVRVRSSGTLYGVCMKMPKRADQQFKVILRILEKMFKKEINEERVRSIISKIDQQVRKGGNAINMGNIVHEIMDVWTKEITLILQDRAKNKTETTCAISDLLRGKIMFESVEDLAKAIDACDNLCKLKGYKIL
jgi:threonine dehydrogenase-like Zn-dependent dehydrogenase